MDFVVNNGKIELYKSFGNTRILHYHFKQARKGCWIYLPAELLDRLGIDQTKDGDFIAFILDDLDDKYSFIALTRESFISDRLRPLLLSLKQQATANLERLRAMAEAKDTVADVYVKGD